MPIVSGVKTEWRTKEHNALCLAINLCPKCIKNKVAAGRKECRICLNKRSESKRTRLKINPEYKNKQYTLSKDNNRKTRLTVLKNYGGLICKSCGETNVDCLTLDHTNNDGAAERKKLFGNSNTAGTPMYSYLKKHNFPDKHRYQVLCSNCQSIKRKLDMRNQDFKISFDWSGIRTYKLGEYAKS